MWVGIPETLASKVLKPMIYSTNLWEASSLNSLGSLQKPYSVTNPGTVDEEEHSAKDKLGIGSEGKYIEKEAQDEVVAHPGEKMDFATRPPFFFLAFLFTLSFLRKKLSGLCSEAYGAGRQVTWQIFSLGFEKVFSWAPSASSQLSQILICYRNGQELLGWSYIQTL